MAEHMDRVRLELEESKMREAELAGKFAETKSLLEIYKEDYLLMKRNYEHLIDSRVRQQDDSS